MRQLFVVTHTDLGCRSMQPGMEAYTATKHYTFAELGSKCHKPSRSISLAVWAPLTLDFALGNDRERVD